MFKIFALLESVRNLRQNTYNTIHLTLGMSLHYRWKLEIQNFCRCGRKRNQIAFLITSSYVINPQIILFPHIDCKWNFPWHYSFSYLRLRLIRGTGNSSHHWDITAVLVNNQHGIQRRGQDFYQKTFAIEGVHSKEVDRLSEWVSSFLTAHQHIIGHSVP